MYRKGTVARIASCNSPLFPSVSYLQYLHDVYGAFTLLVARGGDTLFGRIADGEDGDEIIVCHCGECFLQLRCVEVSDSCRAEAFVVDGKHDVRRDDGGVDIGEVAFIIGAHPCFICFSTNDEKDAGTEGIVRCLREFCTGGRGSGSPRP